AIPLRTRSIHLFLKSVYFILAPYFSITVQLTVFAVTTVPPLVTLPRLITENLVVGLPEKSWYCADPVNSGNAIPCAARTSCAAENTSYRLASKAGLSPNAIAMQS